MMGQLTKCQIGKLFGNGEVLVAIKENMILNQLTQKYLNTKRVSGYVSKDQRLASLNNFKRLDLGENLLGCSPKVLECLKNLLNEDLRFYADPSGMNLKTIISHLYSIKNENVTIANSSNEIIDYLPKMILEPKDKVLVTTPTFFRHIESSLTAGGSIVYLLLKEKDGYRYTDDLIARIIDRIMRLHIKLVWICNPNNPTGLVLDIRHIEEVVKRTNAFVVLDEAFYEFYDLSNQDSGINLIQKYQNVIVLRTLSKAYGLAGLRLGYAMAHEKVIEAIENYRNTLLMTSSIVQKLAVTALQDQQWLKKTVFETKKLREKLEIELSAFPSLQLVKGSKTNVYLLRHKYKDVYEELARKGILTADFRLSTGLINEKYVRVTVGSEDDNAKLINAVKTL